MKKEMLKKMDKKAGAMVLIPKGFNIKSNTTLFLEVDNPEGLFLFIHNKIYQRYGKIDAQRGLKSSKGLRFENAIFYAPVEIGRKCVINAGAVIGEEGFKIMKNLKGNNERLIHIGGVKIGNEVEIGANTCIDKGTYGNTEINDYVKIDNFVHVAHNCVIGENTFIAPMVCLGGSSKIGKNVYIGIGASIRQGITIGDNAFIAMGSVVINDVKEGESVAGNFAVDKKDWKKHHKELNKKQSEMMKF
ncbi:MAG: DapH/DapD/GlmU-related protein [Promethearchaeota archaeon]